MENFDKEKHWENIYQTKELHEVSWFQPKPETSLDLISKFNLPKTAKIIDIGGGDSFLVDHLLELGYTNITVLDISNSAIDRVKKRLGENAKLVKWVVSDVVNFQNPEKYDLWHDRAAFHFLTDENEIQKYQKVLNESVVEKGGVVIGTFSKNGPLKCSGITIKQYSTEALVHTFQDDLVLISSELIDHKTPFDTIQNFVFCRFERR